MKPSVISSPFGMGGASTEPIRSLLTRCDSDSFIIVNILSVWTFFGLSNQGTPHFTSYTSEYSNTL